MSVDFTNKDILTRREKHGWDSRLFLFTLGLLRRIT